jgi:hypothetical protein
VDRARGEEREERQRLVAREAAVSGLPQARRQLRRRLHRRIGSGTWILELAAGVVLWWGRGMNCYIRRGGGGGGGWMEYLNKLLAAWPAGGELKMGEGGELWRPPPGKVDSNQHGREENQHAAYCTYYSSI